MGPSRGAMAMQKHHGSMEASHRLAQDDQLFDSIGPNYGEQMRERERMDESIAAPNHLPNLDETSDRDDDSCEEATLSEGETGSGERLGDLGLLGKRNAIGQGPQQRKPEQAAWDGDFRSDYVVVPESVYHLQMDVGAMGTMYEEAVPPYILGMQQNDRDRRLEMIKWSQLKPPGNVMKIKDDQVKLLELITWRVALSKDGNFKISDLQAKAERLAYELGGLRVSDVLQPWYQNIHVNQAEINERIQWMKQPADVRRQSVEPKLAPSASRFIARPSNHSEYSPDETGSEGFSPGELAERASREIASPGPVDSPNSESLLGSVEKDQSNQEESSTRIQRPGERQQQKPKRFKTIFKQPQPSNEPQENQLSSSRERNTGPVQHPKPLDSNPTRENDALGQLKTDPYEGYNSDKEVQLQQNKMDRIKSLARRSAEIHTPVPYEDSVQKQTQQQQATISTTVKARFSPQFSCDPTDYPS